MKTKIVEVIKDLVWSKSPPTKPGWYWLDRHVWHESPRIVEIRDYAGELAIGNSTISGRWMEKATWAGPIPEPKKEP